jgi:hypothetical protein
VTHSRPGAAATGEAPATIGKSTDYRSQETDVDASQQVMFPVGRGFGLGLNQGFAISENGDTHVTDNNLAIGLFKVTAPSAEINYSLTDVFKAVKRQRSERPLDRPSADQQQHQ